MGSELHGCCGEDCNFIPLHTILMARLWVSVCKILGVSICKIILFGIMCLIQFVVSIPLPLPTIMQIALNVILSLTPLPASWYRRDHTRQNTGLYHLFSERRESTPLPASSSSLISVISQLQLWENTE